MSVIQSSGEASKKKANIKVFFLAMAGIFLIFVLMAVVIYKKKSASKTAQMSQEEAALTAKGNKIAAENDRTASELKQSPFGEGMRFDSQGNLLGSTAGNIPGLENQTFESLANRQGEYSGADIERYGIDNNYPQYQSYQPYRDTSYKNSDPDTARANQEIAKQDRELARESSLVFCLSENITGRPVPQGSMHNAQGTTHNDDGYSDPQVQKYLSEAMAIQNASQSSTALAGGMDNNRFGALNRPLVSRPGQVSDMRIGGLPEITVSEGKFIDGVIVNQIETSFHDSPVTVLVTRDFIDHSGQYILIPQGAKILGQAFRVTNQQQTRMFISFHRILFPDGRSAYFPERQLPEAFNPTGLLGSDAKVNNHWFRKFGSAIVLGVVQGLAAAQAGDVRVDPMGGTTMSGSQYAVQSVSRQFEEVTKRMMDHYANLAPTITVKSGSRIKVYLSEDMMLSVYGGTR